MVGLFRVLGSGGGKGGGLLKDVVGVGRAFRDGAGCLYRGFRVDCRLGQCGLAVPLVVPELFFVWMGRGNWGRCDTI